MRSPRLRLVLIAAVGIAVIVLPSASSASQTAEATHQDFDPENFSEESFQIINQRLPLTPGTQLVYQGRSIQGGGPVDHQVILTVTDLTKVINGVRSLVVLDRDIKDGKPAETELAFHAQDEDGNVWNLGEYPEEFEAGEFVGAPSTWIAGLSGARAGIAMRAEPREGTSSYIQGLAPAIKFKDQATVLDEDANNVCVPVRVRCFDRVLVIDETNLFERGEGHQLKYHASGVGVVRVAPGEGSVDQEELVLSQVRHLNLRGGEMAQVRNAALQLEKRAYEISSTYSRTAPMESI